MLAKLGHLFYWNEPTREAAMQAFANRATVVTPYLRRVNERVNLISAV
jgi:hypothetical protein